MCSAYLTAVLIAIQLCREDAAGMVMNLVEDTSKPSRWELDPDCLDRKNCVETHDNVKICRS